MLVLALVPIGGVAQAQIADGVARALEMPAQRALQRLRERPDTQLAPFVTDGCSGGLSGGWKLAAGMLPGFAEAEGGVPPWEGCCVIHDHAYHSGANDTDASANYDARLAADRALRACVAQSAETDIDARATRFGVTPAAIRRAFEIIAGAMYHAVRIGGMPCSMLPWRWGYGYPACNRLLRGSGGSPRANGKMGE